MMEPDAPVDTHVTAPLTMVFSEAQCCTSTSWRSDVVPVGPKCRKKFSALLSASYTQAVTRKLAPTVSEFAGTSREIIGIQSGDESGAFSTVGVGADCPAAPVAPVAPVGPVGPVGGGLAIR